MPSNTINKLERRECQRLHNNFDFSFAEEVNADDLDHDVDEDLGHEVMEHDAAVDAPLSLRCFSITYKEKTVRFDGSSKGVGLQRGYFNCRHPGHEGCYKYRYVRDFGGDHKLCAAWLMIWSLGAPKHLSRTAHYKNAVPDATVGKLFDMIPDSAIIL